MQVQTAYAQQDSIDDDRENVKPIAIIVATVAIVAIAAVAQLDLELRNSTLETQALG